MLDLGLEQGAVLVTAGTFGAPLVSGARQAGYFRGAEILLGLVLLLTAAYLTWRAPI